jgi:RNA polymerase sigma-70 factor, ECF subfamily
VTTTAPAYLSEFQTHRVHLRGIAYRMTGSMADAEDVLQEAFLRWSKQDLQSVGSPRAFLSTVVTRLCLDQLNSARVRRESYVGPWLPEPVLDASAVSVEARAELASDISVALMLAFERLSPLERAAFLLHDVFDLAYAEISNTLERSEEACRQLVARAREHVRQHKPRYQPTEEVTGRVFAAFAQAVQGNLQPLSAVLAEDAVFYSDGGGKVSAATRPVVGRERVLRFIEGVLRKFPLAASQAAQPALINGAPGLVVHAEGQVLRTLALEFSADPAQPGLLVRLYQVSNPEKLTRLRWPVGVEQRVSS